MPVKITLAAAMGTCFGVQDAIDMALDPSYRGNLTIVGQLVHNPQITERLLANGVRIVERNQIDSITTQAVMITATATRPRPSCSGAASPSMTPPARW
jgi:4-hydroxy-3-methylbut-2-enyl diphosphate reductase